MTSINHYNKALKDIDSKLISLGHLAGQLGAFVGESESVKKAIVNAINILTEQHNKCKNAKNHNLNFSDCQDPTNCQSITQQIEKLKSLKEANKNSQNNPNELLKNLCDGLQTFLGFNKDSKGYTGEGIVYSDLDRLCDAVMGFLYEIISEVKENSNLSPYKNTLEKAVNELNKNLNKGKNGLQAAIEPVKQGIKGWLGEVNEKNKKVMRPLEILQSTIDGHMSANLDEMSITDQLKNWQGIAGIYLGNVLSSETALDGIDKNLRNKIASRIELIKEVVQNFGTSVDDPAVQNSVEAVKNKLTELPQNVNREIGSRMQELQKSLNDNFRNIDDQIKNVRKEKDNHIGNIKRAVNQAKLLAKNLLGDGGKDYEKTYKEVIMQQFTDLKKSIEKFTGTDSGTTDLLRNFEIVRMKVEGLDDDVYRGLEKLKQGIDELHSQIDVSGGSSLVNDQLEELGRSKHKLDSTESAITNMSQSLSSQYNAAIKSFHKEFESLCQHVSKLKTDEIKSGLSALAESLERPVTDLKTVHTTIKEQVDLKLRDIRKTLAEPIQAVKNAIKTNVIGAYFEDLGSVDYTKLRQGDTSHLGLKVGSIFKDWLTVAVGTSYGTATMQANLEFLKREHTIKKLPTGSSTTGFKAMKADAEGKIVAADGDVESFADTAAREGTKRYQDALDTKINGASGTGHGIYKQLSDVIQKLKTPTQEPNGDPFLSAFSQFEEKLNQLLLASKNAELTEAQVQRLVNELTVAVGDLKGAITSFDEDAQREIKNAAKTAIEGVLDKFEMDSSKKINVAEMMKQFDESRKALDEAVYAIDAELNQLKKLPTTVDAKSKTAGQVMDQLKSKIQNILSNVEAILPKVQAAEEALTGPIDTLEAALVSAQSFVKLTLPALDKHLKKQVSQAFSELEECIQQMFNAQMKAEVKALQASVSGQIPKIRKTINDDLVTGLKGLIGKMNEKIDPLKNIDNFKTLTGLSTKAYLFFKELVTYSNGDLKKLDKKFNQLENFEKDIEKFASALNLYAHFSHPVSLRLATLSSSTSSLDPQALPDAGRPVLKALRDGMLGFVGELGKGYVSRYDGGESIKEWVKRDGEKDVLTPEGKMALRCF
ncbi:hypothetical protein, conserved [Babesia bigemina]|uniref:Extracellular matrix-binding ebh n=1 Tax=Babesia bigemina TaxID=5866 RepID=A0A061BPY8_BABBI|nr:hypothetical protein, conserved [Babesia bigemina]CDR71552.1 hypothetical protein, conserved [Babesia bigemina]|eukprot:XP_012770498.1 hypothetical protein, conserved [Babesia bigemina]